MFINTYKYQSSATKKEKGKGFDFLNHLFFHKFQKQQSWLNM